MPANGHPEIPQKELFRIGEVSRLTDTKAFVLRYWETEFPMLQPVKTPAGLPSPVRAAICAKAMAGPPKSRAAPA